MAKLYQKIAEWGEWEPPIDGEWVQKKREAREELEALLPSGSGVDGGCAIGPASGKLIVITFSFHYMDENGYYDGWYDYTLRVRPDLAFGFVCTLAGRDRNGLKDYLYQLFNDALSVEVEAGK